MTRKQETLEGYVVDLACLRSYPQAELLQRARRHTLECARMGHCIESGYGLVDGEGNLSVLDPEATGLVLGALAESDRKEGVYLRAEREQEGEKMKTVRVEELSSDRASTGDLFSGEA